ncbi:UNVERIFIED_CONTAM: hypothetical protein RMT77_001020 [Armadillidium vulgare]
MNQPNSDREMNDQLPDLNPPEPSQNLRNNRRNQSTQLKICTFCRFYVITLDFLHAMKNENGLVECPVLKKVVCKICNATGSYAHLTEQCPQYDHSYRHQN